MSPLTPTSAAPSRRPYAIKPGTFDGRGVEAIWLGRKDGRTTVSAGWLSFWWQPHMPDEPTLDECIAMCDPRYGGQCRVRWDGRYLWVDPTRPLSPEQQREAIDWLSGVLDGLPETPDGFTGWHRLREAKSDG